MSVLAAKPRPIAYRSALSPLARQLMTRCFQIVRASAMAATVGDQATPAKNGLGAPVTTDAPILIIVFAQAWGIADGPEGPVRIKHYYVDESVGIAVGMLLSALHLAGLATLTHTPSPMAFLRDVLDRPLNERAYVVIPVGYPASGAVVPDLKRKSLDHVLVRR